MAGGYDHGVDQEGVRLVLQADPLLRSVVDTADRSGAVLDDPQAGVRLHGLAVRPGEVLAGCGLDGTTVAAGRLRHAGLRAERADVSVGIERPDGHLVDALLEAGHPVVPASPNAIKAWRDGEVISGAKSDAALG